jgi:rubrerythrin
MAGGIQAWEGLVADGPPEAGVTRFLSTHSTSEMAALAWTLEENTRKFYLALADLMDNPKASQLMETLASAEEKHKASLLEVYQRITGEAGEPALLTEDPPLLEGGADMDTTLQWAEGRPIEEVLEIALVLETNAYDRYLKMMDLVEDDQALELFRTLSREEKNHLDRLSSMMDEILESDYEYSE